MGRPCQAVGIPVARHLDANLRENENGDHHADACHYFPEIGHVARTVDNTVGGFTRVDVDVVRDAEVGELRDEHADLEWNGVGELARHERQQVARILDVDQHGYDGTLMRFSFCKVAMAEIQIKSKNYIKN